MTLKIKSIAYTAGGAEATDDAQDISANYLHTQIDFIGFDSDSVSVEYRPPNSTASDYKPLSVDAGVNIIRIEGFAIGGLRFSGNATGAIRIRQF